MSDYTTYKEALTPTEAKLFLTGYCSALWLVASRFSKSEANATVKDLEDLVNTAYNLAREEQKKVKVSDHEHIGQIDTGSKMLQVLLEDQIDQKCPKPGNK